MLAIETPRIATRAQLDDALRRRKTMSHLRLGDALVQEKLVTEAERDEALVMQRGDRRRLLGEILVENGAVTREQVRQVLVEQLGVPSVNLAAFEYDADVVSAISAELARKHLVMPLYRTSSRIAVAIENPLSWEALQELELFTGLKVDPAMANHADLVLAIDRFYGGMVDGAVAPVTQSRAEKPANEEIVSRPHANWVPLATRMIMDAYAQGTLSIHIESAPGEGAGGVRFRVDGLLER